MSKSVYFVSQTDNSFCPKCDRTVCLLGSDLANISMFYICFECRFVGEIGVGIVPFHDIDGNEVLQPADEKDNKISLLEDLTLPTVSVNILDIDKQGRIFLNNACTAGSLHKQGIELVEGLRLVLDDEGWQTEGVVEYCEKNDAFVAVIDWNKFLSPIVDTNNEKRWNYLSCCIETKQSRRYTPQTLKKLQKN
jgi:hypothetical protein